MNSVHIDFYRPVDRAGSYVIKDVKPEKAIRLYCAHRGDGGRWQLQVRGPQLVGGGGHREGKAFMIAGASLTREDMVELRNAIDGLLAEDDELRNG